MSHFSLSFLLSTCNISINFSSKDDSCLFITSFKLKYNIIAKNQFFSLNKTTFFEFYILTYFMSIDILNKRVILSKSYELSEILTQMPNNSRITTIN